MAQKTDAESLPTEIILPRAISNIADQLHFPLAIRDTDGRIIYTNQANADSLGVRSNKSMFGKKDCEIEAKLFEDERVVDEFDKQYRKVCKTKQAYATLEIHPHAHECPYIFNKVPYYDNNNNCVGMIGYNNNLHLYSLNDFIKGNIPGSLLLTKPDDFFSERQCEIMFYRLQGLKAKEVAQRLNITTNTFNNYMQTLYDKCCVSNLDEFMEFCEKRNYHHYLPKRFLTCEAISFGSSII